MRRDVLRYNIPSCNIQSSLDYKAKSLLLLAGMAACCEHFCRWSRCNCSTCTVAFVCSWQRTIQRSKINVPFIIYTITITIWRDREAFPTIFRWIIHFYTDNAARRYAMGLNRLIISCMAPNALIIDTPFFLLFFITRCVNLGEIATRV